MNVKFLNYIHLSAFYISWEMTPTSIGGEKQAGISGGSHPPADIASGRIAEVRSRSMSCNCMTRTSQQECLGILEQTQLL